MVELLAPAGSSESLRAAVNAGADAVYIGGSMFGARAYADNPDENALIEGIEFCHLHGRKLYMTVNTLLKEKELESKLYDYLLPYYENGVDGLIVQDLGVVQFVQEHFPGLDVHASTQMTVTGADGARLLQQQGITRVVPARELSLEEIRRIIDETGIEVETFIHGAMCYSYSGQCLLSSMIGGRSGNRGRCAQPCRLPYSIADASNFATAAKENGRNRRGEFVKKNTGKDFSANGTGNYLLSMKDMCTLDLIPDLIDCGIASMKIEGRMKRPEYTGGVVSIYRKYIDLYQKHGRKKYRVSEEDRSVLMDLYNRGGFSKGYYFMHNGPEMMSMVRPNHYGTEAVRIKQVMKGKVKGIALEDLHKQDVLELSSGNEITLNQDVSKGEMLTLNVGNTPVQQGVVWNRTKNEWLLKDLESRFLKENVKEKIKGDLRIYGNRPAILKLSLGDVSAEVSAVIAEPAQNNPTPFASVEKQMKKTGNTPFVFDPLHIELDDGLFVSVRQLNELRRNGIEVLTEKRLNQFKRTIRNHTDHQEGNPSAAVESTGEIAVEKNMIRTEADSLTNSLHMNILVTTGDQLQAVLEEMPVQLDTIYLDSMLFSDRNPLNEWILSGIDSLKNRGINCFFNFPPVFRKNEQKLLKYLEQSGILERMDGFLLHTIDELSWALAYRDRRIDGSDEPDTMDAIQGADNRICEKKELILAADDNFYTYNRRAAEFLRKIGISRITLPAELNYRELSVLETAGTELNVYGYQALMHSAQCVTKNTGKCTKQPKVIRIRDRKRAEFPVLNRCNVCCNTIYNSVPLQLGDCQTEMSKLQVRYARLSFTIESAEETKQILKQYAALLLGEGTAEVTDLEGTRGHFRRGVE